MEERTVYMGNASMPENQANAMRRTNMPTKPNMPNAMIMPEAAIPPRMPNSSAMPNAVMPPKTPNAMVMPEAAMPLNAPNAPAMTTMKVSNMPEMKPNKPEMKPNMPEAESCGYKKGELPSCAPLAAGYVPFQQKNSPKYATADALTRGTLFPGLDLPFMNVTNNNNPYAGTPLGELMAICFATHELRLYLDTHKGDKEAFDMLKNLMALEKEGRKEYTKLYGPIDAQDLERAESYNWLKEPWPWEYTERTGK